MIHPDDVAAVLDDALDLLRVDGWSRTASGRGHGAERCIAIANRDAAAHRGLGLSVASAATFSVAHILGSDQATYVPLWNDRKGRTFAEVEDVMGRTSKAVADGLITTRQLNRWS